MSDLRRYGAATVHREPDGTLRVVDADPVIGISVELLASVDEGAMPVDSQGCLWLAGDSAYRYRPVGFAPPGVRVGEASGKPVVLVCERVIDGC